MTLLLINGGQISNSYKNFERAFSERNIKSGF